MPCELEQLKQIYAETFQILNPRQENPEIEVRFYPYIGINHTIRVRDGKIFVRIAEICRDMPCEEQKALAAILVSKLLRKKVPLEARKIYTDFIRTQEIQTTAIENKRVRGRKIVTTSKGEIYDLDKIFESMNLVYFQNSIPKPVLTWSTRKTFRILGHYDATHQTIVISRSLDRKKVPQYVVEYVVFHEMLHILHPTTHRNGRRYNHTPEFRRDEKKFAFFDEAERWIERNVKAMKRDARRKLFF